MRKVALDLGVDSSTYCEIADGVVVARGTARSLSELKRLLAPSKGKARVIFEACGLAWAVHDLLVELGHEAVVVDTTRIKELGIGRHKRKNDRIDAERLARALERGDVPEAHVLSPARRELRHHLTVRRALVEGRANLVVTARDIARKHGLRLPRCLVENFVQRVAEADIPDDVRALLGPLLGTLAQLELQIAIAEERLQALCAAEPLIEQLSSAPGVGTIVAAAFVSVIDDAGRFKNAHQVAAYLGLVPSLDDSGQRRRIGAITKQGNGYLRAMLVQAAWASMRAPRPARDGTPPTPDPLREWALALTQRRGKRIAVVAVARRLAGILWAMWRDGARFDRARTGNPSARGLARQAMGTARLAERVHQAAKLS